MITDTAEMMKRMKYLAQEGNDVLPRFGQSMLQNPYFQPDQIKGMDLVFLVRTHDGRLFSWAEASGTFTEIQPVQR